MYRCSTLFFSTGLVAKNKTTTTTKNNKERNQKANKNKQTKITYSSSIFFFFQEGYSFLSKFFINKKKTTYRQTLLNIAS